MNLTNLTAQVLRFSVGSNHGFPSRPSMSRRYGHLRLDVNKREDSRYSIIHWVTLARVTENHLCKMSSSRYFDRVNL